MSYFITGTTLLTDYFNTTGTGTNDVTPRNINDRPVLIAAVYITETLGIAANVTLDIFNPRAPAIYYRVNQMPIAARQTLTFEDFYLPQGWILRVTASASTMSVLVNYFSPNAAGVRA